MKKLVVLLGLSLALVASACSDESTGDGGTGGTGGTGGIGGGAGGAGGTVGSVNKVVPIVCTNNVAPQLSELGVDATIAITPTSIDADQDFDATIGGNMAFSQAFLQAAVGFVPGLDEVFVNVAVATFSASNATNPDPLGSASISEETFSITQVPNPGYPAGGGPCTEDADCVWAFLVDQTCDTGSDTCNPAPAIDCTVDDDCPLFELAPSGEGGCGIDVADQCDSVICEIDDPGGQACDFDFECPYESSGQTCSGFGGSCDAFTGNVCTPLVTAPIVIPLSPETFTYTAGASGDVCFDISGDVTSRTSSTRVNATVVETLPVRINCEAGTLDPDAPDETNDPTYIVPNAPDAQICFPIAP